jgi:hypothetical protein
LLVIELTTLITSSPHIKNDQRDTVLNKGVWGTLNLSLYTYNLWYFLKYLMQSLLITIQNYHNHCIFLVIISLLVCMAQMTLHTFYISFLFICILLIFFVHFRCSRWVLLAFDKLLNIILPWPLIYFFLIQAIVSF